MPKLGMEPIRKRALISAAIQAIHERGSLEITMGQIARRAGVSPGLAHHYFGGKDQLIVATMRHLLSDFGASVLEALKGADAPRARVSAIIRASFSDMQFSGETVSAWLVFYVRAQESDAARRLLLVYARRLQSNLVHALRPLVDSDAPRVAQGIGALIDGLYIRCALKEGPIDQVHALALVEDYVDLQIGATSRAH